MRIIRTRVKNDPIHVSIDVPNKIGTVIDGALPFNVVVKDEEAIDANVGVLSITASLENVTVGGNFYRHYPGPYVCDPSQNEQTFNTRNSIMDDNFKVLEVKYLETQTYGTTGKTATILTD